MARMRIVQRRGFFGWLFAVLFVGWNLWCLVWTVTALAGLAAQAGAAEKGAALGLAVGGTMSAVIIGAVWLTGAVVLGLSAILFRSQEMIVETDGAPTRREPA